MMYASGLFQWWPLLPAADQATYLAAVYGTHAPPWFHRFRAYDGPELSAAADGMSPRNRRGDELMSVLKKGS